MDDLGVRQQPVARRCMSVRNTLVNKLSSLTVSADLKADVHAHRAFSNSGLAEQSRGYLLFSSASPPRRINLQHKGPLFRHKTKEFWKAADGAVLVGTLRLQRRALATGRVCQ
jgi:hypothetical protein